jgi:hypothetical protein
LKELGLFVTSVSTMVTTFNALQASLMAGTNTGSATLTAILRAEKLMDKVKVDGATILLVKTSVLGGSVVTRLNLFTGGHLLHTGNLRSIFDQLRAEPAPATIIHNEYSMAWIATVRWLALEYGVWLERLETTHSQDS